MFTPNQKYNTDDNEKPSLLCYRPFIVVLVFTFKKVGQWPKYFLEVMAMLMAIEDFWKF